MNKDAVPSKPLALALLAAAQFLIVLDASIVNIALPSIQKDLGFSEEHLSWVVNAYGLMLGGFLLLGGRLADLIGRRRVFIAGMTLFGAASLLAGFSASELQLIVCRGAQGLGAALVSPAALSTITVMFKEGKERNKAFGVWGAVGGSGGAIGVFLGGVLTELLGWEWIFFLSVPVALGAALLAPRLLVESREPGKKSYDIPGAITVTAGLTALVYAVVDANNAGWDSFQTIGLLAAGLGLIALFVTIELKTEAPLIPFSIFRMPTLRAANVFAIVNGTCVLALFYAISIYMQEGLGHGAIVTGLGLLPLTFVAMTSSMVTSRITAKVGFRMVLIGATIFEVIGLTWFSRMRPDGSYWVDVLGPTVVIGVGLGAIFVANTIAALEGTDRTNAGLGSGLLNTSQQIGRAIGVALLISVYTSKLSSEIQSGAKPAAALTDGLGAGILLMAGLCLISLLIAIFAMSGGREKRPEPVPA